MAEETETMEEPQDSKLFVPKVLGIQVASLALLSALATATVNKSQELITEAIEENCPAQRTVEQKSMRELFSDAQILEGIERGYLKNSFRCQIPGYDDFSIDRMVAFFSSGNQPIFTHEQLVAMALVTNHREELEMIIEAAQSSPDGPPNP